MPRKKLGETLASSETRIHLCGRLTARIGGKRIEDELPGRQGRMLFAFLVVQRFKATPRAELTRALWPEEAPAAAESALAALLAKLRRVLGSAALEGKHEVRLVLPEEAWVDLEAAHDGLHRAESAAARRAWAEAWGPARVCLHIAERGLLPGYEVPWIGDLRRRLEDLLVRSHECVAAAGLGMGGAEMAAAERSARRLIELAPFRESGYRALMQVFAAGDNVGEALRTYERLREVLRDELGVSPSPATQALHAAMLRGRG